MKQLSGRLNANKQFHQGKGDLTWLRDLRKVSREKHNYSHGAGDGTKLRISKTEERILRYNDEVHPNELKRRSFSSLVPSPFQKNNEKLSVCEVARKGQSQASLIDISATSVAAASSGLAYVSESSFEDKKTEALDTTIFSCDQPGNFVAHFYRLNSSLQTPDRYVPRKLVIASEDDVSSALPPQGFVHRIVGSHVETFPVTTPISSGFNSVHKVKITSAKLSNLPVHRALLDEIRTVNSVQKSLKSKTSKVPAYVSDVELLQENVNEDEQLDRAKAVKRKLEFPDFQVSESRTVNVSYPVQLKYDFLISYFVRKLCSLLFRSRLLSFLSFIQSSLLKISF